MDFKSFIGFIAQHYIVVTGTTLAFFFTTCMVLLIRSIGKKDEGQSGGAAIDVKEIEGAMKRVLASQPVSVVASASPATGTVSAAPAADGAAGGADPQVVSELQKTVAEREARIEQLGKELEQARAATAAPGNAGADEEMAKLKAKLDELQARLAEYEIIEDDIADLSMFKDENGRLKEEIAKLKAELAKGPAVSAAPAAAPVAEGAADAAPAVAPPAAETAAAPGDVAPAAAGGEAKFEKSEKFELDINDDVMKEFATAVEAGSAPQPEALASVPAEAPAGAPVAPAASPEAELEAMLAQEPAPPPPAPQAAVDELLAQPAEAPAEAESEVLSGTPDPDKMLSEVASLNTAPESAGDALEESLDTDKLLAEVDSLAPAKKSG